MNVLVPPTSSSTRAYHTEDNCPYIGERHREWDRQTALEWGYHKCSRCTEIEQQESAIPEVDG